MVDYTKDPCARCGKYPLHYNNKTGYCRECSRRHMSRLLYPNRIRKKDSRPSFKYRTWCKS